VSRWRSGHPTRDNFYGSGTADRGAEPGRRVAAERELGGPISYESSPSGGTQLDPAPGSDIAARPVGSSLVGGRRAAPGRASRRRRAGTALPTCLRAARAGRRDCPAWFARRSRCARGTCEPGTCSPQAVIMGVVGQRARLCGPSSSRAGVGRCPARRVELRTPGSRRLVVWAAELASAAIADPVARRSRRVA